LDSYYLGIKIDKWRKWRRRFRFIILFSLVLMVAMSAFAVLVNIFNIPVPVFNPSPKPENQYIELAYPQDSFRKDLYLYIHLTSTSSFVEGQKIAMSVSGTIDEALLENLTGYSPSNNFTGILVGFEGAPLILQNDIFGFKASDPIHSFDGMAVLLVNNYTNPSLPSEIGIGSYVGAPTQQIEFTSQGDYPLSIQLVVGNNAADTQEIHSIYERKTIHVDSTDILDAQRYNRINEVLSVVLVVFTFVEASKLIYDYYSKQ
jgi:hypothetical protein